MPGPVANEKTSLISQAGPSRRSTVEILVVICCMLNCADRALLPSCFRIFQVDLAAPPARLGMLSLSQSLGSGLALPAWGIACGYVNMKDLFVLGALLWGTATMGLSCSYSFHVHCFWRFINGIGLCGVVPVSQAILAEYVPAAERGSVFGRIGAAASLAYIFTQYITVSMQGMTFVVLGAQIRGWQVVHATIGFITFMLAFCVYKLASDALTPSQTAHPMGGAVRNAAAILRIPSFGILVLQGVTGGIPWNAMAFMSLYWGTLGFTDHEVGKLALLAGAGGVLGELLGGYLGDAASRRLPDHGRVVVAFCSVCLGVPFYMAMFYLVPHSGHWLSLAALLQFGFNLVATWTTPAANKPICAELVSCPAQRAQIIAWWCTLEGVSASILGAPVVGLLSEHFGYRLDARIMSVTPTASGADSEASSALAHALVGVGVISWTCCALAWVAMGFTFPHDRQRAQLLEAKGIDAAQEGHPHSKI